MNKQKDQFIALLGELFQLNQPELDFGLYRILHARSAQIKAFIDTELGSEIDAHFAEQSQSNAHDSLEAARVKVAETLGEDAFLPTGELKPEYRGTKVGKEFELAQQQARDGGGVLADDAQVYEHLYRFFSRYYDKGDFMSKRYFVAENDSRAAPYAVPYDGREVMLHWANKDQYYIKSSEALSNFTFDLSTAQAKEQGQQSGFDFQPAQASPLKVHFRLAAAAEGEHNNVKEGQERFFIIHAAEPLKLETNDKGLPELVIQFDYRPDHEKTGQAATWQQKRLAEAEQVIGDQLAKLASATQQLSNSATQQLSNSATQQLSNSATQQLSNSATQQLSNSATQQLSNSATQQLSNSATQQLSNSATQQLSILLSPAPTGKQPNRTLLGKYLSQFTARNTMDYFIHKNLGGFLRRELDFYIKNEIIRLDDIEAADAPRVDDYLKKLRVLRKIARRIIDFLAQLEDFQKKLWLKKKFVVETQYCITLDRIPESFYPEIAANDRQREEWIKLFAIDDIKADMAQPGYSKPLTVDFLRANPFLTVDTRLLHEDTKEKLIASLVDLDESCSGILLHGDNFQALNLAQTRLSKQIKSVYIDPPYNTDAGPIAYKNGYRSSSWCSLMADRLAITPPLMSADGVLCATIDDYQQRELSYLIEQQFGQDNLLGTIAVRINPSGRPVPSGLAQAHEYAIFARNTSAGELEKLPRSEKQSARYKQEDENGNFMWELFRKRGSNSERKDRPSLFYPLYVMGDSIRAPKMRWDEDKRVWKDIEPPKQGEVVVYPLDDSGSERTWRGKPSNVAGAPENYKAKTNDDGSITVYYKFRPGSEGVLPPTNWIDSKYSATEHGTGVLKHFFTGVSPFTYPKSIYAVEDCLRVSGLGDSQYALDYFGGSGTTGHAVINLNREDGGNRKYALVEMGAYFDTVLKPRIQKAAYSKDWNEGKPVSREGISHCLKYIRLESFEDTLNNLQLPDTPRLNISATDSSEMARDYLLKYWLEFETTGSPSLLNVREFSDPTAYTLKVKQPGSDAQVEKTIDLVETFNWLIGLHVAHLDQPRRYAIELVRETDPELPQDQDTRWRATAIKEREDGEFWFRAVEGHVLRVPGDELSRERVLVIWRKLTGNSGRDQAALEAWLGKRGINPRESEFATIYVNGNHALPSDGEAAMRVRLIEETFAQRMWEDA